MSRTALLSEKHSAQRMVGQLAMKTGQMSGQTSGQLLALPTEPLKGLWSVMQMARQREKPKEPPLGHQWVPMKVQQKATPWDQRWDWTSGTHWVHQLG